MERDTGIPNTGQLTWSLFIDTFRKVAKSKALRLALCGSSTLSESEFKQGHHRSRLDSPSTHMVVIYLVMKQWQNHYQRN